MNAQRPKLQLHRFERVDASATNALLRVSGVWCAEPQLRLEPLALLVDDGRRTHRIAQLTDSGSERAPLAARDAEQWRGTFPVLTQLLGKPDISFAIDTNHGFVMLPFPVHVDRLGGPALSGAPREPTATDEIRLLWQSSRQLEQQVESLGEESSRTRSVAADVRARAARAARDRAERHAREHETRLQTEAFVEAREQELAEAIEHAGVLRDERDRAAERVHELKGECDGLHASIALLAGERDDARGELEERLRLNASRDEARRARLADDLALAQDEQRSLGEELDTARAERDAARAQLDPLRVERAGAFSELVTTNAERKRHQAELLRTLDERARDAQRLDELAVERDAARKDLSRVRDELSARMLEIERERNAARSQAAEAAADRTGDERAREELEQRLDALAREREELERRVDEAGSGADAARRETSAARDDAARMQRRIDELEIAEVRAAEAEGEARGTRSVQEGASAP